MHTSSLRDWEDRLEENLVLEIFSLYKTVRRECRLSSLLPEDLSWLELLTAKALM